MHLYDTCKFFNNYLFCPHIKVTIVAFQDKVKVLGWLIRGLCLHPYTRRSAEGEYQFLVAASAADIKATLKANVKAQQTKVNNALAPQAPLTLLKLHRKKNLA